METCDVLIVGSGFSGAVLARRLHDKHVKVILLERREHVGGNARDYIDPAGILVHEYGPHYFRTNDEKVFAFLSKYTRWRECKYTIRSCIAGRYYPFPINRDTLNLFFNVHLVTEAAAREFLDSRKVAIGSPANAEEQVVSQVGWDLYNAFYKNYTEKQWGIPAAQLDPSVTARIPVRYSTYDGYFDARYQAMPRDGYTCLFENMLAGIDIRLGADFFKMADDFSFKHLVFSGRVDEFFGYKFGNLPYRSLDFAFETHDTERYQDWVQVNYPNDHRYTRIVEIKHVTGQRAPRTTIVKEYPAQEGEPFYPVLSPDGQRIAARYFDEAKGLSNIHFLGRLGTYRYLNMDQAVAGALDLAVSLKIP